MWDLTLTKTYKCCSTYVLVIQTNFCLNEQFIRRVEKEKLSDDFHFFKICTKKTEEG